MSVTLHEIKKIWNIKTIIVVALLCAVYYVISMSFHIEHYPNGHPQTEAVAFFTELAAKYGPTLEPEELDEFLQIRDDLIREADRSITENSYLAEKGIQCYADLRESINKLSAVEATDEERLALQTIMAAYYQVSANVVPESGDIAGAPVLEFMIVALDDIADSYKNSPTRLKEYIADTAPGLYRERVEAMLSTDEYRGIIYGHTVENTLQYIQGLATLVVLTTLILFSPLLTYDRMRKVRILQYTTKTGRKIIGAQLAGVLLSSVFLTTVLVFIFGAIYSVNNTQIFWNSYVSSFGSYTILSVPLTFGQYVMILIGMLYLIGLSLSTIAFVLSRFCSNLIALTAGLIPAAVAGEILCFELVFSRPFNHLCFETGLALFEPIVCVVLPALGAIAALCVVRREKRVDIA